MDTPTLETPRLTLRPLSARDAAALHPAWSDPQTLEHWHRTARRSVSDTEAVLRSMVERPDSYLWALRPHRAQDAIGHVGFMFARARERASFGYMLAREHWGRGLMTEAAERALAWGFETLGIASVELWIYDGNDRSVRVAEKLGCTLKARFTNFNLERRQALPMLIHGKTSEEHGLAAVVEPPEVFYVCPVIECTDVQRSIDFYTRHLGFSVEWSVGSPPQNASLVRKRWHPLGVGVRFERVDREPSERSGRLDIGVADVDAVYAEIRATGLELEHEPVTQPWGLRELPLTDCNGQRLRFITPA